MKRNAPRCNFIRRNADHAVVYTSCGKSFLCDLEDVPLVQSHTWCISGSYVQTSNQLKGRSPQRFHRLVCEAPSGMFVDHINGNPLDNRRCNLRVTTQRGNSQNSSAKRHGKSKYKGVYLHTHIGRWAAQITVNWKTRHLGVFDTEEDAARAYNDAARQLHGEYARLNVIKEEDTCSAE